MNDYWTYVKSNSVLQKKNMYKICIIKKILTIVLTVIILQGKEILVYNIVTASTFNDKIQYPFY